MINYPPKPWNDGDTFNQNGVTYVYDATRNCWDFSELTYNRLPPAIHLEIPDIPSRLEIEFSLNSSFTRIAKVYNTADETSRIRMLLFPIPPVNDGEKKNMAVFANVPADGYISAENYQFLSILPELDLSMRYFCRWCWTNIGTNRIEGYFGALYPSGGMFRDAVTWQSAQ